MAVVDNDSFARFPFLALIRRELVTQLRTRRLFFALLALSIVCAWMVLEQWPYDGNFQWRSVVYQSERLFTAFAMLAMTAGPIIVAAIAGGGLVGERERDSWDLLQLSLISRAGIVAGKLLSPFAMFILTLAVCAPIFSALLFLAGLDFTRAASCLLLIAATTLTCGAIALACSVRARKTVTATSLAFFFVAMFMGLDAVAVLAGTEFLDDVLGIPISGVTFETILIVSPYYVLGSLLSSGTPVTDLLSIHYIFQLIVVIPTTAYCVWALGWGDIPISEPDSNRRRWFRRGPNRPSVVHAPARNAIPDRSNPIFRRELYWGSPLMSRRARRFVLALFLAAFLVSAALAYSGSITGSWDGRLMMTVIGTTLAGAVGCMYVPIACSSAYTKELAISNFDLLRGTLMKPSEIVWGKFKAALVLCLAVWATCFLANLPVNIWYLTDPRGILVLTLTYGSLMAALVEAAAAGLLVSFYSRRGGAAILASYLLIFMLYFGFFLIGAFIVASLGLRSDESLRALVITSPVLTYFWRLVEAVGRSEVDHVFDWFASLAGVAVFAVLTQLWMIKRFDARIEKMADH